MKGVALVGAINALQANGFELSNVAGASAGAITAGVAAAGYSSEEMKDLLMELNFRNFQDGSRWKVKRAWDTISKLGAYKGDAFLDWMFEILDDKGIRTFGDMSIEGETDPRWRWKLKVIVSDVTTKRLLVFPNDAELFGLDPDEMGVASAIRCSMAIPFYFQPVKMGKSYLVDGGMLSNFPIWMFDSEGEPPWPTFGLLLQEDDSTEEGDEDGGFTRAFGFGKDLVKTMIKAHDRRFVRPGDFEYRTIPIPTGDVGVTEFDLSYSRRERLFHNGRMAANKFLEDWDWDEYRQWAKQIRS